MAGSYAPPPAGRADFPRCPRGMIPRSLLQHGSYSTAGIPAGAASSARASARPSAAEATAAGTAASDSVTRRQPGSNRPRAPRAPRPAPRAARLQPAVGAFGLDRACRWRHWQAGNRDVRLPSLRGTPDRGRGTPDRGRGTPDRGRGTPDRGRVKAGSVMRPGTAPWAVPSQASGTGTAAGTGITPHGQSLNPRTRGRARQPGARQVSGRRAGADPPSPAPRVRVRATAAPP